MFYSFFRKFFRGRSERVVYRVFPYIKNAKNIIDIGSGTGDVAFLLQQKGKNVTPVDVADFHGPRLVKQLSMMERNYRFQINPLIQHCFSWFYTIRHIQKLCFRKPQE